MPTARSCAPMAIDPVRRADCRSSIGMRALASAVLLLCAATLCWPAATDAGSEHGSDTTAGVGSCVAGCLGRSPEESIARILSPVTVEQFKKVWRHHCAKSSVSLNKTQTMSTTCLSQRAQPFHAPVCRLQQQQKYFEREMRVWRRHEEQPGFYRDLLSFDPADTPRLQNWVTDSVSVVPGHRGEELHGAKKRNLQTEFAAIPGVHRLVPERAAAGFLHTNATQLPASL